MIVELETLVGALLAACYFLILTSLARSLFYLSEWEERLLFLRGLKDMNGNHSVIMRIPNDLPNEIRGKKIDRQYEEIERIMGSIRLALLEFEIGSVISSTILFSGFLNLFYLSTAATYGIFVILAIVIVLLGVITLMGKVKMKELLRLGYTPFY